ncbi:hypothetical protein KI387_035672, partial [Taxus chinensis]
MNFNGEKGRLQEFSFSQNQKASQIESKGTPTEDREEMEQFVALIDRIEETKKLCKQRRMNYSSAKDELTVKSISPWKPSFQWEDFCSSGIKDSFAGQR